MQAPIGESTDSSNLHGKFTKLIEAQRFSEVKNYINSVEPEHVDLNGSCLLHAVITSWDGSAACHQLLYLLPLYGLHVDAVDARGDAALLLAVRCHVTEAVDALLQSGAVVTDNIRSQLAQYPAASELHGVFERYRPGLWSAVSAGSAEDVRRLINLWCRVQLTRPDPHGHGAGDVTTLSQLAAGCGHEPVMALVLNIAPTMHIAYCVLAGATRLLATALAEPSVGDRVSYNLRRLAAGGATLLYYAARNGDVEICRSLVQRGARLNVHMTDENGEDMPLVFALLQPDIAADVLSATLLPSFAVGDSSSCARWRCCLTQACYRRRNVLNHALHYDLHIDVYSTLLNAVDVLLVCERDTDNVCFGERALTNPQLLPVLRRALIAWLLEVTPPQLLVGGCDWLHHVWDATPLADDDSAATPLVNEFDRRRCELQTVVDSMVECLDQWDSRRPEFHALVDTLDPEHLQFARPTGEGTPLLIRAVLLGRFAAVQRLTCHLSAATVDSIRDGFRRTALHYASAVQWQWPQLRKHLLHLGCSDHTLDVNGREPLDFLEVTGSDAMEELLELRINQDYESEEPNPWEPALLRALQEERRMERFGDPSLSHGHSHGHSNGLGHFPRASGSDFTWPLPVGGSLAERHQAADASAGFCSIL